MAREIRITDAKSAETWLKTQDLQTQLWFAVRSLLRNLPVLGAWEDATENGIAFTILRATVISAASARYPSAEINPFDPAARAAAAAAHAAADAGINTAGAASAFTTAYAASTVAHTASGYVASDAGYAAAYATTAAAHTYPNSAAARAAFSAASDDANQPMQWGALWESTDQPEEIHQEWEALKAQWADDPEDWAFWISWYEGILNGTPLDWEITQRIALEVTTDEWDAGPRLVGERIREIMKSLGTQQKSKGEAAPTDAQKKNAAIRVSENRNIIALSVAGLRAQLEEYRERVRGQNSLDPEHRDSLLRSIDGLSGKLGQLLAILPDEAEVIDNESGGKILEWLRECRVLIPGVAKRYAEPEHVVEIGIPVGIILSFTAVGTMIGGPGGALVGTVAGGLISNQMKPGQAAKALLEKSSDAPES